jgi:hypothetical protein
MQSVLYHYENLIGIRYALYRNEVDRLLLQ